MKVFRKFEETEKYKTLSQNKVDIEIGYVKTDNSKVNENLLKQNTELLKQNEALVGMLKRMLSTYDKGTQTYLEANELLNTLNK